TPSTTEEVSTQAVPSNSTVETKTEDKEATEKAGEDNQEAVSQTNTTATTEMADPVQETTVETPKIEDGYFRQAKKDDYGYYIDFKLSQNQKKQVSYLINNKAGDNLTGDQHISLLTPEMNEAWAD
ncbi:pullulanase-associated domain-containing protein, partial [Streptococcus suis]